MESKVYRLTDTPIAIESLRKSCHALMEDEEFNRSLQRLDQLSLIFKEGGLVVGLALPRDVDSHQALSIEALRSRSQNELLTGVGGLREQNETLVSIQT